MRQITAAFISICILIGAIRYIYCVESRQLHQEELEMAMEISMRHSLTAAGISREYSIADDQELYADFLGELFLMLGADAEFDIKLYEVNLKKGIMDVEITSYFTMPGGKKAQVSCRKCAAIAEY